MSRYSFKAYTKLRLLIIGLLFICPTSKAQNPDIVLNLSSVERLSENNDLTIKMSREDVTAAHERLAQAKALRYGQFQTDAQYLRYNDWIKIVTPPVTVPSLGTMTVPATLLSSADSVHARIEGEVPLLTGWKIPNLIGAGREGERAAKSNLGEVRMDAIFEAEQAYLEVLLSRDIVRLHEEALTSYKQHFSDANNAFVEGVVAKYDLIRAEAAVSEQEKRLTEARNQFDVAAASLRTALVLPESTSFDVEGKLFEIFEPLSLSELRDITIKSNPGLQALEHKVEALHRSERAEFSDYLPSVTAVGQREMVTTKLAQTDPHWIVGAQAKLTLLDGGARRARLNAASAATAKAKIEYEHAVDHLSLALRIAFLELDSQHSALSAAQKTQELAEESLRLATKRFSAGTGTSLEVLDANVALTGARIGVQTALYRIDLAYLKIHKYAGDIHDVIDRINQ